MDTKQERLKEPGLRKNLDFSARHLKSCQVAGDRESTHLVAAALLLEINRRSMESIKAADVSILR